MKILDKLVLKGFIGPYIVAFLIAEFVLVMQFLWKYIDEIIGKGISIGVLFELIFYFAVTIIPLAIPITILISSVMVFGNLAEKHELSSFKSAGVSLFRVLAAGFAISVLTGMFSFFASNFLKPNANYQFFHRLNSIRKQKLSLSIEPGVFNRDFKDFVMHVGQVDENGRDIGDILIYDHSGVSNNLINVVSADHGEMFSSDDGSYFIMKLYDGHQYNEEASKLNKETKVRSYPMTRTNFNEWTKIFDMSQFEMEAIDVNMDRRKYDLLNSWQLKTEIDTFSSKQLQNKELEYFKFSGFFKEVKNEKDKEVKAKEKAKLKAKKEAKNGQDSKSRTKPQFESQTSIKKSKDNLEKTLNAITKPNKPVKAPKFQNKPFDKDSVATLVEHYSKQSDIARYISTANVSAVRDKDFFFNKRREYKNLEKQKNVYILRRHQQFSWACICVLFLFIGAPLGSIIRKGGYGYPLLVSIILFMIFVILNILGEKMNKSEALSPYLAAWLPVLVLLPFALFITKKAVNDEQFDTSFFLLFKNLFKRTTADS